ncbi:MAG: Urea carboxylase-related aminomethyltransferase [Rhodospirillaceae bacterium]|nr:Urea carboxylase-related aminomethyltransferase [Rhodospirillaceae bacterium]|tara:strand:+ start:1949 stop:2566 length:618 start_codon:yes stop_codon:yes gene_type:complete
MARAIATTEIRGYGNGFIQAKKGQTVRITDVEGHQVADVWAVNTADHDEYMSPATTRMLTGRMFPGIDDVFLTTRDRPILTFIKDTSPGRHDMLFASCCRALYARRGHKAHPNCRDNYFEAIAGAGIDHANIPDPVNIFQNTPPQADGSFLYGVAMSRAGDHVEFRAEMNCIVVVTACSSELINAGQSTPLRLETFKAKAPRKKA